MRSVESEERGNWGVWKMKCGVRKMRSVENV